MERPSTSHILSRGWKGLSDPSHGDLSDTVTATSDNALSLGSEHYRDHWRAPGAISTSWGQAGRDKPHLHESQKHTIRYGVSPTYLPKPTKSFRALRGLIKHGFHNRSRKAECSYHDKQKPRSSNWIRRTTSLALRRAYGPLPPCENVPAVDHQVRIAAAQEIRKGWDIQTAGLSPSGGAAARAAAAAQNEILENIRPCFAKELSKTQDPIADFDSESGIGIDLRDRDYVAMEPELCVNRIDPALALPEEMFTNILLFLDAQSLMRTQLVSKRWYRTATARIVWKTTFQREFGLQNEVLTIPRSYQYQGGSGVGDRSPTQDWQRMWRVRKALHARWSDGYAGAIYLEGHQDTVYCVQFDEYKIITGSRDRTVRVWDARTYHCMRVIGNVKPLAHNQPYSPVIVRSNRGQKPFISIHPAKEDGNPPTWTGDSSMCHSGSILCLQFDAELMVTGSSDTTLIAWSVKDEYQPIRRYRHHSGGVLDVCFDINIIVSCSKDTTICIWARSTGELLNVLTGHRGPVNAVQLRGGELLVSASGDGVAKLWNLTSGACIKEFQSRDRGLACVEFSQDSCTIFAGGNDQVVFQYDANSGELLRELRGHSNLVRSLHLDNSNARIISGSYDHTIKVFDTKAGKMLCDFAGWTTSWILSAKSDYRRIVATSQDRRVVIIDFGLNLPGIELLGE